MPTLAVLFDLDGTLANTSQSILDATNAVLEKMGKPDCEMTQVLEYVGYGPQRLIQMALGTRDPAQVDLGLSHFCSYYAAHGLASTFLYEGIALLLDQLTQANIKLAVVSNKEHAAVLDTLGSLFGRWHFEQAVGIRPGYQPKPDPAVALQIAEQLQVLPEQCCFVGDSEVDIATGQAAGMIDVGVTWGFRSVPDLQACHPTHMIDQPLQLLDIVGCPV